MRKNKTKYTMPKAEGRAKIYETSVLARHFSKS